MTAWLRFCADRDVSEIVKEWERLARDLGWDGRDNRIRMDDVTGPWINPVEYRLRDRKARR